MKEPPIKPTHEWPESGFKIGVPADPPQAAPINQAQGCFRVLLWVMPAGFAAVSAWAVGNYKPDVDSLLMLWIGVNLVFMATTGWFVAIMSSSVRVLETGKRTGRIAWLTTLFCLIQLFLIPFISVFLVFAFCAFMPR